MRPLRLKISAFGPYAGVETVDFRELGDKRFFVITGPTGAGKTSVLDAMTFALYGDTTGDERSGKDMRSLFASADSMTDVTFDFSVGRDSYRVWRRPEQERPKLRGEGTTTEKPDAGLWLRNGAVDDADEGEAIASGLRDVDAKVRELLGFDCDQFRQVVVLPQGRFREVLSADVKTREEILRQLFKTDRFAKITEHFKAVRNQSRRSIDGLSERRRGVLESVGVESREQLDEQLQVAVIAADEAKQAAGTLAAAAEAARAALELGRDAQAALDEARDAAVAHQALRARAEDVEQKRTALVAARKALGVQSAYDARERAARSLEQVSDAHKRAVEELPALEHAHVGSCEALESAREAKAEDAELERLQRAVEDARRVADDVGRLAGLRSDVEAADKALGKARDAETAAITAAADAASKAAAVDAAWRAAQASVLAATLEDGAACPVCGSTEHPAPAAGDAATVSDDDLDVARSRSQRLEAAVAAAAARVAAAEQVLESATRRIGEETERLGEMAGVELRVAQEQLTGVSEQLAERQKSARKAVEDLAACEEARTRAQNAFTAATARVETLAEQLAGCALELETSSKALAAGLAAAEFDDERDFLAVRRTAAEIDALEGVVRTWDENVVSARERLERATAAAQVVGERPDLDRLAASEREARTAADAASRALGDTERVVSGHRDAIKTIERFEEEAAGLFERHALVARLADVAEGSNELKLSFQRYVLGAYLDEVLEHANYRLQSMTGGRYRLERSTAVGHRGRPSGLALAVFDELAGEMRPAGTLSGGEGFLASLALALGLAEAVQAHSGGVKLETIFVDEGFGTLDPEALEMAIATLLHLAGVASEQGRLVGIISHVPELKERIDARLEITPGERGSSARFVV